MNKETIKQQNSMRDVLSRYGMVPNRAGFVRCPFHPKDCTASMKIYKDSYYCFGCGATGDIFTFVQNMDNCDFKTAFTMLGGTYQKPDFSSRMAIYHAQKQKEMREKAEWKKKEELQECLSDIDFYRSILDRARPLSDGWCEAWNKLQLALYKHGFITGLEEGD
jgi:DNA primase